MDVSTDVSEVVGGVFQLSDRGVKDKPHSGCPLQTFVSTKGLVHHW